MSSKSDEYAVDSSDELRCILLCRVLLGETLTLTRGGPGPTTAGIQTNCNHVSLGAALVQNQITRYRCYTIAEDVSVQFPVGILSCRFIWEGSRQWRQGCTTACLEIDRHARVHTGSLLPTMLTRLPNAKHLIFPPKSLLYQFSASWALRSGTYACSLEYYV
eukprot:454143-Amphidinium_carterae.1